MANRRPVYRTGQRLPIHHWLWLALGVALLFLLPSVGQAQSTCPNPYYVQPRDNLTQIARNCGVNYRDLLAANPQITNPNRIEVGDPITIPGASAPINLEQALANATYTLTASDTGTITLRNGRGLRAGPNGEIEANLIGPTTQGDINRDGIPDAATILLEQTAQTTGRFYSLHLMLGRSSGGQIIFTEASAAYLEDRIRVNSIIIEPDGDLRLDMLTKGPADPLAFSTLHLQQTYRLQGNQLQVVAARPVESAGTSVICPNTYPTRLQQNGRAYVLPEPPLANRVRNAPSRQAAEVGRIQPRAGLTILAGPHCADEWIWWYIQADNGLLGWVSEGEWAAYWLQPSDPSKPVTPGLPTVSALSFCTALDRNKRCLNPATTFAADLQRIEVNWTFQNLPHNTRIHHRWYRNGQLVYQRDNVIWPENSNKTDGFGHTFFVPGGAFAPGTWQVDFLRASDNMLLETQRFTIVEGTVPIVPPITPTPTPPLAPVGGDFNGRWQSNFAMLDLTQRGNQVTGSYTRYSRTVPTELSGTVTNGVLNGINQRGIPFTFYLGSGGNSFTGEWTGDNGARYPWCGVRNGPLPDGCGFSGYWYTNHSGNGWVALEQTGNRVRGRYFTGDAEGTIDGTFGLYTNDQYYSITGTYQADNDRYDSGFIRFILPDLDSSHFEGCWRNEVGQDVGNWCGWPGVVGSCPRVTVCQ